VKRFWDVALAIEDARGWSIELDGRPVRVPGGGPLLLGTRALAEAVAAEWQAAGGAKGGETGYAQLPLTRLAGTAQERINADPEAAALEIARYGESDLLCYRADRPAELVRRQAALWQPWLDWAMATHGAALRVASGVMHVAQPPEALARLAGAVRALPATSITALGVVVPAVGSLVLGLAVAADALSADLAFDLSILDEMFQAELWGEDAEAAARRALVRAEMLLASRFMTLARA
jgi:chaperone required for assembly of F1-ATPase